MKKTLLINFLVALIASMGYASPVASANGADGIEWGDGVWEPTAADYIQDGLVGCYDSYWNLGPDNHDETNEVYEWFSGQPSKDFTGSLFDKNVDALSVLSSNTKTVQVCVRVFRSYEDPSTSQKYIIGSSSMAGFSLQSRMTSARIHFLLPYVDGKDGRSDVVGEEFFATITIIRDEQTFRYFHDGVEFQTKLITSSPYSIMYLQIPRSTEYFKVTPYRIAIYDRALTLSEVTQNSEIDKIRFGVK